MWTLAIVDPAQPMSIGALIAIIGVALTWIMGVIGIRRWLVEERNRRRGEDAHLEEIIIRVCRSFTDSDAYQMRLDRAMISVANGTITEAFRERSKSFVDAGVDEERRKQMDRRMDALEKAISDLRAEFAAAAVRIAKEVASELRKP